MKSWLRSQGNRISRRLIHRFAASLDRLNQWVQAWANGDRLLASTRSFNSEAWCRQIIATANEGIWILDADNRTRFVNPKMAAILGYSTDDMVGKSIFEFMDHAEIAIALHHIERRRQGAAELHDFKFRHKNGSDVWTLLATNPLLDDAGCYQGAVAMVTDISDRKYAELALKHLTEELEQRIQERIQDLQQINAQLRDSEVRFQTFMDNSPLAAWITTVDGVMVYVNQPYRRMFQVSMPDILGKSVKDLYPEAIAEQFLSSTKTVATTRQVFETIEPTPRPDGTMGDFLVYKFPISSISGPLLVGGVAIDVTERKHTEDAIRLSQEQLQLALEGSGDGLWDWNTLTGETYRSPRWLAMLGYEAGDLPGHTTAWKDLLHPDDKPRVISTLKRHLQDGKTPYQVEYRARTKTGEWRWIADYGKVVAHDAEGQPLRMVGLQRDISDRKQAEVALQESQQFTKTVLDTVPLPIFWKDRNSIFLGCNQQLATLMGLQSTTDIVGRTGFEFSPTEAEANAYRADDQAVMASGQPKLGIEEAMTQPDGELHWLETHKAPLRDVDGNVVGIVGMFQDITARKRAEVALRQSERRYATLATIAPVGIYRTNPSGDCLYVNERWCQIAGMTTEAAQGRGWLSAICPDDRAIVNQVWAHFTQTGEPFGLEYRFQRPDGTTTWVFGQAVQEIDENGEVRGYIGTITDIGDRKHIEQELQDSRNMLKMVLDTIPQRVFWKDRESRFLGCNPAFAQDYQLTYEQIVGKTDRELPWAEWADFYRADDAEVITSGIPKLNYEELTANLNGDSIWIRTSKIPLTNSQGEVVGVLGCYDDITSRKWAEEALQAERLRLQLALEVAEMGTWESDIETNLWSARTEAIFGYTPGTFPGDRTTFLNHIHPDDREQVLTAVTQSFATRSPYSMEYRIYRRDGQLRWISVKGKVVQQDKGPGLSMVGVTLDVTERKQAEAIIQQSEQDLRTIFNNVYDAIFIHGTDGAILDVNNRALELNCTTREQLLNASIVDLSAPNAPLEQLSAIFEQVRSGKNVRFEWNCQRLGDRSLYVAEVALRLVTLANRSVCIAAVRDISERKHLEQELRQINLELERRVDNRTLALQQAMESAEAANRAKSTFLANMSHELRTPLNAILGFAQLMSRDRALDGEKRQQLKIINRSGEHLLNLINDILEMSKIEAGRVTLNPTAFDLYGLLDTLEEMFRLKATEKDLQLQFDYARAVVPQYIETDENKLRQVLINLVGNAIKFTQQGQVTLQVTVEPSSSSKPPGGPDAATLSTPVTLVFEVNDTGAGIAFQELEELFEPFKQSDNQQVAKEGTGLGLPISRQFVQMMGGELTVESQLGQGSTFRFTVEVQRAEALGRSAFSKAKDVVALAPGQSSYRILVVEDQPTNQQLLVQLLKLVGFEVQAADNGQDAIALWESWHPHLIWMDMRMPIMNGYEATQHIRHREHQQNIPHPVVIVALTASAFEEERAKVLDVGCNDFVRKPFRDADLLEKIADYLGAQYLYAEDARLETAPMVHLSAPEAIAALETLPVPLLNQLYEATIRLDDQQLIQLLDQVESAQPALTATLRNKLDNFDLETILDWLQIILHRTP